MTLGSYDLPKGAKAIGFKWIYKTKLNERGEVHKYKARLVANSFHQTHGVDFSKFFAHVARWDAISLLLGVSAQKGWSVYQLDVKSAFLNIEIKEDVCIEQPSGFESKEESEKVLELKKTLYGLRQIPKAWYNGIEGYFMSEGFTNCYFEHHYL